MTNRFVNRKQCGNREAVGGEFRSDEQVENRKVNKLISRANM